MLKMRTTIFSLGLLAAAALPMLAQELPNEGPVPTTALVNAEAKGNARLDPSLLKLQVNGHDAPILGVTPVGAQSTEVAILIDDGLRSSFSLQLKDVQNFVTELPPGTKVLVGYMQNGMVRSDGHFSSDHAEVASSLRITMSTPGLSASPYLCLSDFVKRWPSNQPAARMVLMITNGVDPYNGRPSIMNQDSPYVETAQEDAQRAGVAVYSIYFPDAGFRGGYGSFSGQSYLQQVAEATGAQTFNQGSIPPVSIRPYLKMFQKAIVESYQVNFMVSARHEKASSLTVIRLKTSQSGIKLHAPDGVHAGLSE
ncbi:MAG: hypothetical protein V4555_11965 [Acidobacteriota bacterium]